MMQKMSTSAAPAAAISKMNGFENKANASAEMQTVAPASTFQSVLKSQVQTRQPKPTAEAAKQHTPHTAKQVAAKTANQTDAGQKTNHTTAVISNIARQDEAEPMATSKAVDEMVELAGMALPAEAKSVNQDEALTADPSKNSQPEGIALFGLMPTVTKLTPLQDNAHDVQVTINTQTPSSDAKNDSTIELGKPDVIAPKDALIANSVTRAGVSSQFNEAKPLQMQSQDLVLNAANANQDVETPMPLASAISGLQKSLATPSIESPQVAQQVATSHVAEAFSGKATWNQAISQRVLWMVGAGEQSATLTLNPPDLGPLQVVVHVHNGMADTRFTSDNAEVRQALQDGMDNLREKMRESGVQLGQTNVQSGEQSRQEFQQTSQQNNLGARNSTTTEATQNAPVMSQVKTYVANGLVDTFA
ncbi:MAG: flagellar hook-length control protein FliK [Methylotenera sp.]|jgi:flagellar hook-length control protein FliK|nr:flagellar hook-length control protein FliK [Methylotenera sp.]HPH09037.1 flagellar hook-length control protein FliK [Methylotenera sp.]HPM49420.1 flagellar hook-length control protein FliK [Methylotenera sp.]